MSLVISALLRISTNTLNILNLVRCYPYAIIMPYYAVKKGRAPGVYETWAECQEQVTGFYGAKFKKFSSEEDAMVFAGLTFAEEKNSSSSGGDVVMLLKPIVNKLQSKMSDLTPLCKSLVSMLGKLDGSEESVEFSTFARGIELDVAKLVTTVNLVAKAKVLEKVQKRKTSDSSSDSDSSDSPPPEKKKKPVVEPSCTGKSFGDEDGVVVFTDGCCFHNGRHGASAGIGVFWGDDKDNISERLGGRQTNNRAEIHAAIRAVEQAKEENIKNLIIKTDSQFLINCITKWVAGWKKKGWVKSNGDVVANKDDLIELDEVIEGINVKWVHVDGHMGVAGNEAADKLANKGARLPIEE